MQPLQNLTIQTAPRIRPVDSSHIADLIQIADETNLSHWSAQSYLDEMKNPDAIMFRLVTDDNLTIGFVVGRIVFGGILEQQLEGEMYNIAIRQSEQGRGLGQLLFDAFKAVCRDKKASGIWLEVRESNRKAISFYEKNGFSRVQTRNNFYDNPREHAILMRSIIE